MKESAGAHKQHSQGRLTPELRAWVLKNFKEEEFLDGLRDLQENGGLELADFLSELESGKH